MPPSYVATLFFILSCSFSGQLVRTKLSLFICLSLEGVLLDMAGDVIVFSACGRTDVPSLVAKSLCRLSR